MSITTGSARPATQEEQPRLLSEEEALDRLRSLIEAERVEEARRLAATAAGHWPDSAPLRRWARVLEPPEATLSERKPLRPLRDTRRERRWLREHRHEYPGCWIAVLGDRLLAADPDLARVHAAVRAAAGDTGAVIWFQDGDSR